MIRAASCLVLVLLVQLAAASSATGHRRTNAGAWPPRAVEVGAQARSGPAAWLDLPLGAARSPQRIQSRCVALH